KDVAWASDDETVATVDPTTGLVAAVGPGTATISATSVTNGDAHDEITVIVRDLVTSIMLTPTYRVVDLYGEDVEYTITPVFTPATANEVYWLSTAPDIADIDENGKVTCFKSGYAVFYAYTSKDDYYNHGSTPTAPHAISLVKVVQHVTEIKLHVDPFPGVKEAGLIIGVGQTIPLIVTMYPADAADLGYTIISGDTSRLSVSGNKIKGLKTGDASVTIVANDQGSTGTMRTLPIKVVAKGKGVTSLKLSKTSLSGGTGAVTTLKGTSSPSKASYKSVRWYSDNTTVATIDGYTGKLVAGLPGTATIYGISTSGIIKSCKVTVKPQLPTSVHILNPVTGKYSSSTSGVLGVGEVVELTARVNPEDKVYVDEGANKDNKKIKWGSSKPTVAMVSNAGKVYAVSAGTAYIYAKSVNGKSAKIKITVKNHSFASSNSSSQIKIVDDNGMLYAGGTYSFGYELYLNRGFYGGYRSIKDIARDHGDTNYDDFDNIYYSPLSGYDFIGVDYKILAANRTNTGVIWETSNTKIATIDKDTGVLTAHKTGDVWVRAKSRVNSKAYRIEKLHIDPPSSSLTLKVNDSTQPSPVTLTYGDSANDTAQLTSQVTPSTLAVDWKSSNDRIARVDANGRVTATGIGTATISAIPAGIKSKQVQVDVTVNRKDGTSDITYRALVIGLYQTSGQAGYLPFGSNSTSLVRSAISRSNVDGHRYKITFRNNSQVKDPKSFKAAVDAAFDGSKEGDVSLIFLHTHGTVDKYGAYRWHLSGTGSKAKYLSGGYILDTIDAAVNGHVILNVASCYSGNEGPANSIITLARQKDAARHSKSGDESSLSIISSTDGRNQSGYLNTASSISVDFFSVGFYDALDQELTVPAMLSRVRSSTAAAVERYGLLYGSSSQKGTNNVQLYSSPRAADIVAFDR
ncbi:MAG: hypothetical protein GX592_12280, partial [Clostridiales bacterium]|nr:hypothetical protein [Clostridiales bacterium]